MSVVPFNVKDYGAVGNGSTDDTSGVQAALNAAGLEKGTVIFPIGTYMVDELTVPSGVTLLGVNRSSSILKLNSGQMGPIVSTHLLVLSTESIVEHLTLDGNVAQNPGPVEFGTSLIRVNEAKYVKVQNCVLKSTVGFGIFATFSADLVIHDNEFTDLRSYAVMAMNACHRIKIASNRFHCSISSAIKIHSSDAAVNNLKKSTVDPTIVDNVIDYRKASIPIGNTEIAIEIFNPTNQQELVITATGGTYKLRIAGDPSKTTGDIAWNASKENIESEINAVTTGLGNLASNVHGTYPTFRIQVVGYFLEVDPSGLTGPGSGASLVAIPPSPGVVNAYIAGNRIWGSTQAGSGKIFGISAGGCTRPIIQGNCIVGHIAEGGVPSIDLGLEAANAIHPVFDSNIVSNAVLGLSVSGQTVAPRFTNNTIQNTTLWGIQLYGNYSGQNQSSVTHALISGNTFIDSGTDNPQFSTILLNDTGSFSMISNNTFVIKDSPNPIRAINVYATYYGRTESVQFTGNLCSPDLTGSSINGYGIAQIQLGQRCEVSSNTSSSRSPSGVNDNYGVVIQGDAGNGHVVRDNRVFSALTSFSDTTTGGEPTLWLRNDSYLPSLSDYELTPTAIKQDNRISGNLAL